MYVTILPSLVAIDALSGRRNVIFVCHMTLYSKVRSHSK